MTATPLQAMIGELERLRQSRVILYVGQDQGQFLHQMSEEDALPLFQCLRQQERVDRLDLVLNTKGGSIPTAHWLCHLLHAYGKHVSVLVPNKARSAATLLCLGADEIVMGPFAQLGPIDPHIAQHVAQRESSPAGNPPLISAEDIRVFKDMAKTWFGIQESEHNIQLLQLVCGRIFPTSLTAFFRAAQQIEVTAEQHLRLHLPEASPELRRKIAEYFIHGCYSHDYIITRDDARDIGLNITSPSPQEESVLWQLWEMCAQGFLTPPSVLPGGEEERYPLAIVASTNFLARCVERVLTVQGENDAAGGQHPAQVMVEHQWEILPAGDSPDV
jgi:Serine dehydrogenase proteinase